MGYYPGQFGIEKQDDLPGGPLPVLIIPICGSFPHPLCLEASVRGSIFRVGIRGPNDLSHQFILHQNLCFPGCKTFETFAVLIA